MLIKCMEWVKREHSKKMINRAGDVLIGPITDYETLENSFDIINNWRSAHYYPLNTFKVTLRRKSKEIDLDSLVAQRIKRLSSIELKLRRFPTMKLSQMQDIGGCRAILTNIDHVRSLVTEYEKSELKHTLDDKDDYITSPKKSGYRGVHLIYKCLYDTPASQAYNDQFIEMQLRSRLQHAWATAVETVGTFLKQSLKSSQGEEEWLRFFMLMGSIIALREKSPIIPNTPSNKDDLIQELRQYENKLNALHTLRMFGQALSIGSQDTEKKHHFFLLLLEPSNNSMRIQGFPKKSLEEATARYLEVERSIENTPGSEAVLVSADSFNSLRRAYPNYFLDTKVFLDELTRALR